MVKTMPAVNFWTKERVMLPPFNYHGFHRVDFQSDDIIIGFMDFGSRTAETLTTDDIGFLTSYFFPPRQFEGAEFAYDIVGRAEVQTALPGMRDTFLRIKTVGGKTRVYEVCSECMFENSFLMDCTNEGYQTKCAECGAVLMLCDECQHLPDGTRVNKCDFRWIDKERGIGTCHRRDAKKLEK
jgi:hypothetical protein